MGKEMEGVIKDLLDRSLFSVQEKIELIKLEVHQCHHFLKQSWPLEDIEDDLQVKCIDYVLENMKDLIQSDQVNSVVGEKKRLNTLERRLRFLRISLQLVAKSGNNSESCNIFPELDSLVQLKSLKVFYYGKKLSHGRFTFPSNLKKLTLSKSRLPWSDIATIATLPNLEVLKLLFKAFDGKKWETRDDEFPKLKYLKLESLDIEQWNISSEEHFPVLEKLVVHRCKQLEEIPSIVGDINTLQMIEVTWCKPSAANSARKIYQEQQEYGNEGLEVIIHSYQGLASSS